MSGSLSGLAAAFDGFGQAAKTIGVLWDASRRTEQIERQTQFVADRQGLLEQRAEASERGAADALAGRSADPQWSEWGSYRHAAAQVQGERAGFTLSDRFASEVVQTAPPGADLRVLADEWIKTNFGQGLGDPTADRYALSRLGRTVETAISNHRANSVKVATTQTLEDFAGTIGRSVRDGQFTPSSFTEWTRLAKTLNIHEPQRAQAFVLNAALGAVPESQEGIDKFLGALRAPESGSNGQSFADANPQAYTDIEDKLVVRSSKSRTFASRAAWDQLGEKIGTATTLTQLQELTAEVDRTNGQFTSALDLDAAKRAISTRMKPLLESDERRTRVGRMLAGAEERDGDFLKKNLDEYLASVKTDDGRPLGVLTAPAETGLLVARTGVVTDDMRFAAGRALLNFTNPQQQVAAFTFATAIVARTGNVNDALAALPEQARPVFQALRSIGATDATSMSNALAKLAEIGGPEAAEAIRSKSWATLLGKKPEEVDEHLAKLLERSVGTAVGREGGLFTSSRVEMRADLRAALEANAKVSAVYALNVGGQGAVEAAVTESGRDIADRIEVLPRADGSMSASLRAPGITQYPDGVPVVRLAPRVRNPLTGKDEDTVANAQADLKAVRQAFSGLVDGGALGLGNALQTGGAMFPVVRQGSDTLPSGPVAFIPGESYTLGSEVVKLPDDPVAAATLLTEKVPMFRDNPRLLLSVGQFGEIRLMYRGGFTEGLTLAQREAGFDPAAARRQRDGEGVALRAGMRALRGAAAGGL